MAQKEKQTDFLNRILECKRMEIEEAKRHFPERYLRGLAEQPRRVRSLRRRLSCPGPNIIAEIKRASPSKGSIRKDLDPAGLAGAYERGGAAALSVLTDINFFAAEEDDLQKARSAVLLPVLRKDFIISEYQIYETAAMGADAFLVITRAVDPSFLKDAVCLGHSLGLDVLVEVHSRHEFEIATRAKAVLIGINNRDLATFNTDIGRSISLSGFKNEGQILVSESGIKRAEEIRKLMDAGICNFLIGESLVRADDPQSMLSSLLEKSRS